jgi:hypothetical protein
VNPLEALIKQLQQSAGPRGATFAGRVIGPDDDLQSVLSRLPLGELESGGTAMQSPEMLSALATLFHVTTTKSLPAILKEGLKSIVSREEPLYLTDRAGADVFRTFTKAGLEETPVTLKVNLSKRKVTPPKQVYIMDDPVTGKPLTLNEYQYKLGQIPPELLEVIVGD